MIILRLFWSFTIIGFTSFGGLSMIPLIRYEMLANHWMTATEMADIIAIAEITPGPLGLNCATFAGMRAAGMLGAIAATIGILMPSITISMFAAVCYQQTKNNRLVDGAMSGIRPACCGMIFGIILEFSRENYFTVDGIDLIALSIGVSAFYLLYWKKASIPLVMGIAAIAGGVLKSVLT